MSSDCDDDDKKEVGKDQNKGEDQQHSEKKNTLNQPQILCDHYLNSTAPPPNPPLNSPARDPV